MEPRFFKRGNRAAELKKAEMIWTLQWNHVFSNVEISPGRDTVKRSVWLQWNHVFSNVEMHYP